MARQATGVAPRVAAAAEVLRDEKFNARRIELAEAALETLGELGFARTSLREIAQNSAFTHGVFHYYFSDKLDLICCCVRHYKAKCVTRYDEVVTSAQSRAELTEGFLAKLAATLENEARMHRLWYDLRSQAMFEPAFRKDVLEIDKSLEAMIWRVASRYAELEGKRPTHLRPRSMLCLTACSRAHCSGTWRTTRRRSPTSSAKSGACCRRSAEAIATH